MKFGLSLYFMNFVPKCVNSKNRQGKSANGRRVGVQRVAYYSNAVKKYETWKNLTINFNWYILTYISVVYLHSRKIAKSQFQRKSYFPYNGVSSSDVENIKLEYFIYFVQILVSQTVNFNGWLEQLFIKVLLIALNFTWNIS